MFTRHGHHIPNTKKEPYNDSMIVRACGGIVFCNECLSVAAAVNTIPIKGNHMEPVLVFQTHVRKPFTVEALEVTEENLEDVAEFVGEVKVKEDGTRYIAVNRKLVPNVYRVFPGYFVTQMGDNVRCYSPKIFNEQFKPVTEENSVWILALNANDDIQGES